MSKKNKKTKNVKELKENVASNTELEQVFVEDPLFRFLKKWQNVIFWVLLLVVVGYFGHQKYTETRLSEQREDADLFEEFRPIYANIITLNKDIREKELRIEREKKENKDVVGAKKDLENLQERLSKSLVEANSRIKPLMASRHYGSISKLYSAQLKRVQGDDKGFEKIVGSLDYNNFQNEKNDSKRFYKELTCIIVAKTYLEDKSKIEEGKKLLMNLAKNGKFFNVVAFNSLEIVSGRKDVDALSALKSEILTVYPEQAELLK
ncbi:MAG: hypothetical protein ACOX3T_04505 [Bdellovibrionota bacterium]